MSNRSELLEQLNAESRRHYAAWTLLNQKLADAQGLHPTDLQCLNLLEQEEGPQSTGRIAEMTGLTAGSATRLVDRLTKAGLVVRQPDPHDRRRAMVALSPAARTRLNEAWEAPGTAYDEALASFSDDELAVIREYFRRIQEVGRAQALAVDAPGSGAG
ncbi:MarR family winged helix-turn-helix transcriptional regulator [Streptomyces gossypii]|uniref:MarR family winged helix-turn-helix transcriptional regulator n=1 Tax=Streptomyces gossypii TaxID=2883101 RepID=UPI0035CCCD0A